MLETASFDKRLHVLDSLHKLTFAHRACTIFVKESHHRSDVVILREQSSNVWVPTVQSMTIQYSWPWLGNAYVSEQTEHVKIMQESVLRLCMNALQKLPQTAVRDHKG